MMPALIKAAPPTRRGIGGSHTRPGGAQGQVATQIGKLSGGEQQRVALARALVLNPLLLLADEPTGNLDKRNSEQIHDLLLELNRDFGMTLVVVTHNMELAAYMSRRVTISEGQLVETN